MLLLLIGGIVFLFLTLGAAAFVICMLLPATRRYALSTALWFAAWGPITVALLFLAGLSAVAAKFVSQAGGLHFEQIPKLPSSIGWTLLAGVAISVAAVATSVALAHQVVIHRLTFAMFRIYATLVCAGIGSVLGLSLCWWYSTLSAPSRYGGIWTVLGILSLLVAFGSFAFRYARALRGRAPKQFTWITSEEFCGHAEFSSKESAG